MAPARSRVARLAIVILVCIFLTGFYVEEDTRLVRPPAHNDGLLHAPADEQPPELAGDQIVRTGSVQEPPLPAGYKAAVDTPVLSGPLKFARVVGNNPAKPLPFPLRRCFPCDWDALCKHAEGQLPAPSRWDRITGVYWQKILAETYCGVSSDCEKKRHPPRDGPWCGQELALARQVKTGRCCEPALVNVSPDRVGTTALTHYLNAHANLTMGLTKEHNWLPSALGEKKAGGGGGHNDALWHEWAHHFPGESDNVKGVDMSVYMSPASFTPITKNAKRFKELFPSTRILVMLRNPVERLYAVFRDLCYVRDNWHKTTPKIGQARAFDLYTRKGLQLLPQGNAWPADVAVQIRSPPSPKFNPRSGTDRLANANDYSYLETLVSEFREQLLIVPSRDMRNESSRRAVLLDIFEFIGESEQGMDWAITNKMHRSGGGKGWPKEDMWASTRDLIWEQLHLAKSLAHLEAILCAGESGMGTWPGCVSWVRRAWGCDDPVRCWPAAAGSESHTMNGKTRDVH